MIAPRSSPTSPDHAEQLAHATQRQLGTFLQDQLRRRTAQARRQAGAASRRALGRLTRHMARVAGQAVRLAVPHLVRYVLVMVGLPALVIALLAALLVPIFLAGGAQQHAYTDTPPTAPAAQLDAQITQRYQHAAQQSVVGAPVPADLAAQWAVPWGVLAAVDRIDDANISVAHYAQYSGLLARALRPHITVVALPRVATTQTTIVVSGPSPTPTTTTTTTRTVTLAPFEAVTYAHTWNAIIHIRWKAVPQTHTAVQQHGTTRITTVTTVPYYTVAAETNSQDFSRLNHALQAPPFALGAAAQDDALLVNTAMTFEGAPPNWIQNGLGAWLGFYAGPLPPPSAAVEQAVAVWTGPIHQAAARYRVPAAFIAAIMAVESGGNPTARSPVGAVGLLQVMPVHFHPGQNPWDPATNIAVGTAYLAGLMHQFPGQWNLVAAGYNAGPAAVSHYGGIPPYPETLAYVPAVLAYYHVFDHQALFQS